MAEPSCLLYLRVRLLWTTLLLSVLPTTYSFSPNSINYSARKGQHPHQHQHQHQLITSADTGNDQCFESVCNKNTQLSSCSQVSSSLLTGSSNRRDSLRLLLTGGASSLAFLSGALVHPGTASAAAADVLVLRLETPQDKAGLALQDVKIGNPPRTVVAIQRVLAQPSSQRRKNIVGGSSTVQLQPGLILVDSNDEYPNARAVADRIRAGPYPIELTFRNLDASNGALGEGLTAQDALQMSRQQTVMDSRASSSSGSATMDPSSATQSSTSTRDAYVIRVIQQAPRCKIKSQRDDVLEIIYEARIGSSNGIIYDASDFRGTGRPYQMVMGSGDMIPGVDQGLYDMCPGEVRQLEIPPNLAYGAKGNKLFRIPPNSNLVWQVELVSVFSMRPNPLEDEE